MHYKPEDIPILTETSNGCLRSIKAGDMELGASWILGPMDTTQFYKGLPDDTCPCDHYGYVMEGSFRIRYTDGTEETVRKGELYYIPKGHVFIYDEPCYHLEVNPHNQLQQLMQHFNKTTADGWDPDSIIPPPPAAEQISRS
jgi:hypothetical protein